MSKLEFNPLVLVSNSCIYSVSFRDNALITSPPLQFFSNKHVAFRLLGLWLCGNGMIWVNSPMGHYGSIVLIFKYS